MKKVVTPSIILALLLLSACKPEVSTDIYAGDLREVAETGQSLTIPVRLNLPIQNVTNCEEDKAKMLPSLEKYGENVRFQSCSEVSGEIYDHLVVEMDARVAKITSQGDAMFRGMFGVAVRENANSNLDVYFVLTENVQKAVEAIDRNYIAQTIELEDVDLTVRFNNDLRETTKFVVDGSFVNGNPVDSDKVFELKRRDVIEVVPSDVRSKSIITTGKARFATLIIE